MCESVEKYAKSYVAEAVAEAVAEGYKKGRKEERLEAIKNMLKQGYSKESILNLNYSEEEIRKAEDAIFTLA